MKNQNFSKRKILVWTFLLLFVFGAVTFLSINRKKELKGGVVKRLDLIQKVTVSGIVEPHRKTLFTPPYNAYIRKIHVKLGEKIKENAPVVSLAQSLRNIAEETYPLRAPFSGTVVQILRTEGEYVEQGKDNNGLVRIDDLSQLYVKADISESDIGKITPGLEAVVKVLGVGDKTYSGVIREIFRAAKEKKDWDRSGERGEFPVRVEIIDKDERIRTGMSAIVDVIAEKRLQTLTLPHEYIFKEKDTYRVTLINGEKREIMIGLKNEELFEVLEGVKEGEIVRLIDFLSVPKS